MHKWYISKGRIAYKVVESARDHKRWGERTLTFQKRGRFLGRVFLNGQNTSLPGASLSLGGGKMWVYGERKKKKVARDLRRLGQPCKGREKSRLHCEEL